MKSDPLKVNQQIPSILNFTGVMGTNRIQSDSIGVILKKVPEIGAKQYYVRILSEHDDP